MFPEQGDVPVPRHSRLVHAKCEGVDAGSLRHRPVARPEPGREHGEIFEQTDMEATR
jgi:hypothetical protein